MQTIAALSRHDARATSGEAPGAGDAGIVAVSGIAHHKHLLLRTVSRQHIQQETSQGLSQMPLMMLVLSPPVG
jgi:hypothetical protein